MYIMVNCRSNPELHMIQDPASKLHPREDVSVVRYTVGQTETGHFGIDGPKNGKQRKKQCGRCSKKTGPVGGETK